MLPINPPFIFNTCSQFFYIIICLVAHLFQIKFYSVDSNISLFCKPNFNSVKPGKSQAEGVLEHDNERKCNLGFEINKQAMLYGFTWCNESYSFWYLICWYVSKQMLVENNKMYRLDLSLGCVNFEDGADRMLRNVFKNCHLTRVTEQTKGNKNLSYKYILYLSAFMKYTKIRFQVHAK